MIKRFFTVKEAAALLGLAVGTLANYCRTGRIGAQKRGGVWLVPATAMVEFNETAKRGYKADPLPYKRTEEGIQIPISGEVGAGKFALVSHQDEDLAQHRWYDHSGYAARTEWNGGDRQQIRMHREVMERVLGRPLLPEEEVDHIDGNPLDNRRPRLRVTTPSQNQQNRHARTGGTSVYKGVVREGNFWAAYITVNGKRQYLGSFPYEALAASAYDDAARRHFGEYANLNLD